MNNLTRPLLFSAVYILSVPAPLLALGCMVALYIEDITVRSIVFYASAPFLLAAGFVGASQAHHLIYRGVRRRRKRMR